MNEGIFSADDLIKMYAPPNLASVMPGNKVMLRSGGPEMTVCDVAENGDAVCQWIDGGKLIKMQFSLLCLTCYGAK